MARETTDWVPACFGNEYALLIARRAGQKFPGLDACGICRRGGPEIAIEIS
jgi:hypothetical protein